MVQEFRHALLDSVHAASIARYYQHVEDLNTQAGEIEGGIRTDVHKRIRFGLAAFEENLQLTSALLKSTPAKYLSSPPTAKAIAEYRESERRNRRLIAAAARTRNDLAELKRSAERHGIASLPSCRYSGCSMRAPRP